MTFLADIWTLIRTELRLEIRNKFSLASILLFSIVLVFIVFKAFNQFSPMSWNVLYWIIILFLSSNTVLKTFSLERSRTGIYYYTLLDPFKVIISKIIYNFLLLFLLGLVVYLLFIYFTFDAVQHRGVFLGDLALVSFGLSIVFSFSSAIANGESNSGVLISILGLPLVLPILLMGIKISTVALGITSDSQINMDFILLAAIDVLLAGIVIILFPILWKS